jgi:hypothetical protein
MAHDTSPTRNRTIVAVAAGTLVSLVGIKFALDSYFLHITEATAHEKLVSPEQLISHREAEQKALSSGPMPIDQAMAEVGRRGRDTLGGGGVDLAPRQSEDTGPLIGWSKMPHPVPQKVVDTPAPVPTPAMTAAPTAATTAPATAPDGGAPAPAPHHH